MNAPPTVDANIWVAAFDETDRFHADSTEFLRVLAREAIISVAPAVLLVEVACALTRRFADPDVGMEVAERLSTPGRIRLEPLTDALLSEAVRLGTGYRLRAADALYAATAALRTEGRLVSWDGELVARAGAVTPTQWLAQRA